MASAAADTVGALLGRAVCPWLRRPAAGIGFLRIRELTVMAWS